MKNSLTETSKFLSYVLRHEPQAILLFGKYVWLTEKVPVEYLLASPVQ